MTRLMKSEIRNKENNKTGNEKSKEKFKETFEFDGNSNHRFEGLFSCFQRNQAETFQIKESSTSQLLQSTLANFLKMLLILTATTISDQAAVVVERG